VVLVVAAFLGRGGETFFDDLVDGGEDAGDLQEEKEERKGGRKEKLHNLVYGLIINK